MKQTIAKMSKAVVDFALASSPAIVAHGAFALRQNAGTGGLKI